MTITRFDTLIIGQGLAGSALAWHLIGAGQRVCVIDDGHVSSSSLIAAGLINPLAGMRFNLRPDTDDCLRASARWYAELQQFFGPQFHHPLPMLRLFRSAQQRRFHARRLEDPGSAALLGARFENGDCPEPVAAPFGGFAQHRTGYVDLPLLLATLRDWLMADRALRHEVVALQDIETDASGVSYRGMRAQRLVFCDGARLRSNPWFSWLPLAPDKGEILNVRDANWTSRHIVNGAHWIVPLANGEMRLGATHDHKYVDSGVTPAGRDVLLAAYAALRPDADVDVTAHRAGVRPGTVDRHPFIGRHPERPALWVCNGFGARGALTVPWYAACLADHLTDGSPLPPEADIRRL